MAGQGGRAVTRAAQVTRFVAELVSGTAFGRRFFL